MAKKIRRWLRRHFGRKPKAPKKPYTKPVLTIIDLDPEQAIITQCAANGVFMHFTVVSRCEPGNRLGDPGGCSLNNRGMGDTGTQTAASELDSTPS
ncbi:MAG: hypothetical protein WBC74_01085 [Candidatus Omnitrophota bacterium]